MTVLGFGDGFFFCVVTDMPQQIADFADNQPGFAHKALEGAFSQILLQSPGDGGFMGGDGGNTDIYSYVEVNGEVRYTCPAVITVYNSWDRPVIEGIEVKDGDVVTVGIHVCCDGAGAWGKIDDAKLNSIKRP